MPFEGKVVLVTGSSRGIGKETALEFARNGAGTVILHHSGTSKDGKEKIRETAQEIKALGCKTLTVAADFSHFLHEDDPGSHVEEMCRRIKDEVGQLDIFIANAARSTGRQAFEKALRSERLSGMDLAINVVYGISEILKHMLPLLQRSEGTVITISSVVAVRPESNAFGYTYAKRAVEDFTRLASDDLLRRKINIKCLRFGPVRGTDSYDYFVNKFPGMRRVIEKYPQFVISPDTAARQIVRYCDPDDRWLTHGDVYDLTLGMSSANFSADFLENKPEAGNE